MLSGKTGGFLSQRKTNQIRPLDQVIARFTFHAGFSFRQLHCCFRGIPLRHMEAFGGTAGAGAVISTAVRVHTAVSDVLPQCGSNRTEAFGNALKGQAFRLAQQSDDSPGF
ncbi:MAG: hypothetical protein J6U63_07300 [Clostridia bacterium]|nr:hypothetical protein [Clostridia bacterium]